MNFLVGVDEAGRGPLAGPVAVGAVLLSYDFDWEQLANVDDSKKLSAVTREQIFKQTKILKQNKVLDFQVCCIGPRIIDDIGIVPAVRRGVARATRALLKRGQLSATAVSVKLDGALRAPSSFTKQETIIGGDGKEQCIGLASILAKVTRDRYMQQLALGYPQYGFEVHKGYGTKLHCENIRRHGLSDIHRRSFCRRLQD